MVIDPIVNRLANAVAEACPMKLNPLEEISYSLRSAIHDSRSPEEFRKCVEATVEMVNALNGQEVTAREADFEAGTWTFDISDDTRVSAGRFLLVPLPAPPEDE